MASPTEALGNSVVITLRVMKTHHAERDDYTGDDISCPSVGAMLSRPSTEESSCIDMPAAKACSPCRDSILLPRGPHAFAAGRARATTLFSEGRESMAPDPV